jgi:hypothetical protein
LGSSSATTVSTALPLFALDCRYHRLLLAPLCARSRSLEPASSRTIIAPVWATTAQHASGQAAVPYPGTGGASRGCAVFAWCRTAVLTGHRASQHRHDRAAAHYGHRKCSRATTGCAWPSYRRPRMRACPLLPQCTALTLANGHRVNLDAPGASPLLSEEEGERDLVPKYE